MPKKWQVEKSKLRVFSAPCCPSLLWRLRAYRTPLYVWAPKYISHTLAEIPPVYRSLGYNHIREDPPWSWTAAAGGIKSACYTHPSRPMKSLVPELVHTYRVGQGIGCILQRPLQRTTSARSGMSNWRIKPKKPFRMRNRAGPLSRLIRIGLAVLLGSALLPRIGSVVADAVDFYPGSGEKEGTTAGGGGNMLGRRESIPGEHRCRTNRMRALRYAAVFIATGSLTCWN